ncbi:Uncharacterised protein [Citrobacter koseri]|uniref:Uncharacterized protein n=1 Tax=Citrobacter koseri TaxID=545 RepID=A0A2X2VQ74_CITKO|nr:Uncharacterised protein [Citrobacter koseri]
MNNPTTPQQVAKSASAKKDVDERSDANGRYFTDFSADRGGIWLYRT